MNDYIISVKPIDETPFFKDMKTNPKTSHYDKYTVTHLDIKSYFKNELNYDSDSLKELVTIMDEKLLNVTKYKFEIKEDKVYVITKNELMAKKFENKLRILKIIRDAYMGKARLLKKASTNEFLSKTLLLNYEELDMGELMRRVELIEKSEREGIE